MYFLYIKEQIVQYIYETFYMQIVKNRHPDKNHDLIRYR